MTTIYQILQEIPQKNQYGETIGSIYKIVDPSKVYKDRATAEFNIKFLKERRDAYIIMSFVVI